MDFTTPYIAKKIFENHFAQTDYIPPNITSDQLDIRKRINNIYHLTFPQSHIFQITNAFQQMLILTTPPTQEFLGDIKLPFSSIFIDTIFDLQKIIPSNISNVGIRQIKKIKGLLISQIYDPLSKNYGYSIISVIDTIEKNDVSMYYILPLKTELVQEKDHLSKFLIKIILNFITFLHHPNVKIITKTPTEKNKKPTTSQQPIKPTRHIIILDGILKKYEQAYEKKLHQYHPSHSWWVRGFWRRLESDKFTNKKGKIIWIAPHIRGEGNLIKNDYTLKIRQKI